MAWNNKLLHTELKRVLDKIDLIYDEKEENSHVILDLELKEHEYSTLSIFIDEETADLGVCFAVDMNDTNRLNMLDFINLLNSGTYFKVSICKGRDEDNIFTLQLVRSTVRTLENDIMYLLTTLIKCDKALKSVEFNRNPEAVYEKYEFKG